MKPDTRWLVCGLCSALVFAFVPSVALAQMSGQQSGQSGQSGQCSDIEMLQHKCGQQSQKQKTGQAKPENKYPHATRKEPKIQGLKPDEAKTLNEGLAASNNPADAATALKDLQPIADSSGNAYAKALAMLGLAQVKYHGGDTKGAITLEKQALDSDALDNNTYFQALETLAQYYIADEDYSDALTALNKWSKESGAESADIDALKGNAYYRLQKYPEAVAAIQKAKTLTDTPPPSWDQIEMASYFAMDKYDDAAKLAEAALAKDPNNGALLQNVIAIYVNAHQDQKALALLERARANGQIKSSADYMNMAKIYDNLGQASNDPKPNAMKAVSVLKEGMDKGIVQPDYETYKLLGDSYAIAGDYQDAVVAYAKASPDAKTGEVDFMRGQMLDNLGRHKEAVAAMKQAISKGGLKHVGAAYLTLGNAELALKQRSAAIAAFKQAEQDPGARAEAQRALRKLGQK